MTRFLGRGGMGRVYLCRDLELNVEVAIKVLPEAFAEDQVALKQIHEEARAAARFRGIPGILSLYGLERYEGTLFLVMEYAAGGSLHARLRQQGPLPESECRRLGAEVAEALSAAHENRLLHRDIKPANLLLDSMGRAKIADFGIAMVMAETHAQVSKMAIAGTPVYMAPEIIRRRKVDHRADLYSLGCMLFEMSTGKRPFLGTEIDVLTLKLDQGHVSPDPRTLVPAMSDDLALTILRLMDPDPERRFPTASECAAALRSSAPPSPATPTRRAVEGPGAGHVNPREERQTFIKTIPARRSRLLPSSGLAAAMVGVVMAVVGFGFWLYPGWRRQGEYASALKDVRAAVSRQDYDGARNRVAAAAEVLHDEVLLAGLRAEIARGKSFDSILARVRGALARDDFEGARDGLLEAEEAGRPDARIKGLRDELADAIAYKEALRLAETASTSGDTVAAKVALQKAIALRPLAEEPRSLQARVLRTESVHAAFTAAQAALQAGDLPAIRTSCQEVRKFLPLSTEEDARLKSLEAAADGLYEKQEKARQVHAHVASARAAMKSGETQRAMDFVNQAQALAPEDSEARVVREEIDALVKAEAEAASVAEKKRAADLAIESIRSALDSGDAPGARKCLDHARDLNPADSRLGALELEVARSEFKARVDLLIQVSTAALDEKDTAKARSMLGKARDLSPEDPRVGPLLAQAETIDSYLSALAMARSNIEKGDFAAARFELGKAQTIMPGEPEALDLLARSKRMETCAEHLALARRAFNDRRFADASRLAAEASSADPDNREAGALLLEIRDVAYQAAYPKAQEALRDEKWATAAELAEEALRWRPGDFAAGRIRATGRSRLAIARFMSAPPKGITYEGLKDGLHLFSSEPDGATMVLIPHGEFRYGPSQARVFTSAYLIDRHEVTNEKFARFCKSIGDAPPRVDARHYDDDHPATGISPEDARKYAAWAGKQIPTEVEWERAARGGLKGMAFPWGNFDDPTLRNGPHGSSPKDPDGYLLTSPVGAFPPNRYGLFDIVGNVAETCESLQGIQDETLDPRGTGGFCSRGGSFLGANPTGAGITARSGVAGGPTTGLRCILRLADLP